MPWEHPSSRLIPLYYRPLQPTFACTIHPIAFPLRLGFTTVHFNTDSCMHELAANLLVAALLYTTLLITTDAYKKGVRSGNPGVSLISERCIFITTYIIRKSHGGSVRWSVDTVGVRSARKSRRTVFQLLTVTARYQIEMHKEV